MFALMFRMSSDDDDEMTQAMEAVSPTAPELLSVAPSQTAPLPQLFTPPYYPSTLIAPPPPPGASSVRLPHPPLSPPAQSGGRVAPVSARPPTSLGGRITPTPLASAPDLPALPGTAGRYSPLYTDERNGGRWGRRGRVSPVSALPPAPLGRTPTPIASVCSSSAARYCREIYSRERCDSRERDGSRERGGNRGRGGRWGRGGRRGHQYMYNCTINYN